jgi:hypothetical protein
VIAAYHIDHDHWDNARALADAKAHKMAFLQIPRQDFIRNFRPLTIEAKATAGNDAVAAAIPATSTSAPAHQ